MKIFESAAQCAHPILQLMEGNGRGKYFIWPSRSWSISDGITLAVLSPPESPGMPFANFLEEFR